VFIVCMTYVTSSKTRELTGLLPFLFLN